MDRQLEKKRWPPRKIIGLSLTGLFVCLSVYGFLQQSGASRLNVEAAKLTISPVERGPFQEFIPVRGTVLPIKTMFLEVLEAGRVEQVYVEEGSIVRQGDPLLKLTNPDLELEVMHQEAPLDDQINQLRNARLNIKQKRLQFRRDLLNMDYEIQRLKRRYERYIILSKESLIARQDYEDIKEEYEHAIQRRGLSLEHQQQDSLLQVLQIEQQESEVKRVRKNVEIVRRRLDDLIFRAPIAGQLTSLDAEIGESKGRSVRLGQIDVLDRFKVRAGIDEHYIARISRGQRGTVELNHVVYGLRIRKVYPEVADGRFEIDLEFEGDEPAGIRRGQTLHLRLELGDLEEAVLLARGGFYQESGGNWAYVLDGSGAQASQRPIRLGRQNTEVFEVLEGLEPGDRVITSGYENFGGMDILVLK